MMRRWLGVSAVVLTLFVAGCEEMESKPGAGGKKADLPPEGTSKSMENMQGAAGLAPPGGLQ